MKTNLVKPKEKINLLLQILYVEIRKYNYFCKKK